MLDLFSGIGGFSLGLERAGMRTVAFCEIEPYCRAVLRKHWPGVPIYEDVRHLTAVRLRADGIKPDVICGGFPCQDISAAGKGAGIDGARSGLWREYARIIGEVRPRYVIVENVAALLGRGLERVLGDLAALGFDAEWHCIPACAVGAPHRRDRVWIVAYAGGERFEQYGERNGDAQRSELKAPCRRDAGGCDSDVADAARHVRAEQTPSRTERERIGASSQSGDGCDAYVTRLEERRSIGDDLSAQLQAAIGADWWLTEPDVGRVANGISARVDRLRSLGNAVVPQVVEIIGRAIMRVEHADGLIRGRVDA